MIVVGQTVADQWNVGDVGFVMTPEEASGLVSTWHAR
jgi:hypothetical protein